MLIEIDNRQLGAILAALRLYQREEAFDTLPKDVTNSICDIATNGDSFEALDVKEIDELCESINGGDFEPKVVVVLEGGLVQETLANCPAEVAIVDYDIEGGSEEGMVDMPQVKNRLEFDKDPEIVPDQEAERVQTYAYFDQPAIWPERVEQMRRAIAERDAAQLKDGE